MAADKTALRAEMARRRRQLTPSQRAAAGAAAARHLAGWPPFARRTRVLLHVAVGGELPTADLWRLLCARGVRVALPRLGDGVGRMEAAWADAGPLGLVRGRSGIPEPPPDAPVADGIEAVVVPGLAFDRRGGRVGTGGGYYDRFLASSRALKVGWGYAFQCAAEVPVEAHDVRLDALATERGVAWAEGGRLEEEAAPDPPHLD